MIQRKAASAPSSVVSRLPAGIRLFVLDTNVLMHDPTSLFRFEEHDLFIPMATLEELDGNKKGMSEVSRNARQASRYLDELVGGVQGDISSGIPLEAHGDKAATGRVFLQTEAINGVLPASLPSGKADNQIIGVVKHLQEAHPKRQVILVSKDINMRIKARALGLAAEDYFNDKVLEDTDLLYTGILALPADFWEVHGKKMESWQQAGNTFYRVHGPLCSGMLVNQFVFLEGDQPFQAQVREVSGKTAILQMLKDHSHQRNNVWGITARNREQNFALNALMQRELEAAEGFEVQTTRIASNSFEDYLPIAEDAALAPQLDTLKAVLEELNINFFNLGQVSRR
ncbi:MAG: PhoH family protein, partial [Burkholderiales bacterium]